MAFCFAGQLGSQLSIWIPGAVIIIFDFVRAHTKQRRAQGFGICSATSLPFNFHTMVSCMHCRTAIWHTSDYALDTWCFLFVELVFVWTVAPHNVSIRLLNTMRTCFGITEPGRQPISQMQVTDPCSHTRDRGWATDQSTQRLGYRFAMPDSACKTDKGQLQHRPAARRLWTHVGLSPPYSKQ